jgi:hypothetical protein
MSKVYLISTETLKTIGQGALGAMTFGAYHQFTTNKIMELNNENMENRHKKEMSEMENQHRIMNEKINKLESFILQKEKQSGWFY